MDGRAANRPGASNSARRRGSIALAGARWVTWLCLLGLLGACGGASEGDAAGSDSLAADSLAAAEKPAKEAKEKSSSVTVAEVIRGDLVIPIIAEGVIQARHSSEMRPEISGRIATVHCQEGQRVRRGQLLISLDDRDYKLALREARAIYLQALSTVAVEDGLQELWQEAGGEIDLNAELEDDILEQLKMLRNGEYRAEIAAARTGLAAAIAAEERAKLNLERCEIRAPFAGIVSGLRLSTGEWINANQTLFKLTDDLDLEAEVNVLESDLGVLEQGRPVLIAVPALADTFLATVDVVNPTLDSDSRSCRALLRVKNSTGTLKPGMFVRAAIAGEILPDRLLVPREAILTRDNRPLVFKVADGLSQWLYVQLGARNETFVEIERVTQGGDLAPGDKIVVSDHLTLTHGAKVKVKKTLHPSVPWQTGDEAAP